MSQKRQSVDDLFSSVFVRAMVPRKGGMVKVVNVESAHGARKSVNPSLRAKTLVSILSQVLVNSVGVGTAG